MTSEDGTVVALLVWDFDGTLADTYEAILASAAQALAEHDLGPCDPAVVRGSIGLSLGTMFQQLVADADAALVDELVTGYRAAFEERGPACTTLFAGMSSLLDRCAAHRLRSAIATSKGRAGVDLMLERLGVAGHFPVVVSDEDVTRPKPDPEMIARPFGALGIAEWSGTFPTVIALHGRAGHAREWDRLAGSLVARHLVAPDLRGHGESDWAEDYRLSSMVGDVIGCIDATTSGPVDVVGHSLGGLVAMVLASDHPQLVRRLVIADIGPELHHLPSPAEEASAVTFASHEAAVADLRDRHPITPTEVLTDRVMHGLVRDPAGGWRWRHDPAVDDISTDPELQRLWDHWGSVVAPTLVIRGGESTVLPGELVQRMQRRAQATVDLACIADASHDVHVDRPEEFGDLVLHWVEAC